MGERTCRLTAAYIAYDVWCQPESIGGLAYKGHKTDNSDEMYGRPRVVGMERLLGRFVVGHGADSSCEDGESINGELRWRYLDASEWWEATFPRWPSLRSTPVANHNMMSTASPADSANLD